MSKRNITLSLPEETLEEVKIIAVKRRRSVSALMTELLEELVAEETGYLQAERRFLTLLERGFDMGTRGNIEWSREEVHER